MPGHLRLIAATALAVSGAACAERAAAPPPTTADPAGLVGFLTAHRDAAACALDAAGWRRLVTPAYVDHPPGPAQQAALAAALAAPGPISARVLYADDPAVPAALRRARPILPVGRPPLVAFAGDRALPALFVVDGGRWRCLADPDGLVLAALPDPACRAAYQHSARGRCLDLTAPVASAALAGDGDALARRCALLVRHGCGSVPAESPP